MAGNARASQIRRDEAAARLRRYMDRRRLFRSPWFWIVTAILLVLVVPQLFRGHDGYTEVDTSKALAQIDAGNYTKVKINDKEQTLDIILKNPVDGDKKITASYPDRAAGDIFHTLSDKANDGRGPAFDTNVSQQNVLAA